jgi:hypothetical protein
LPRKLAAEQLAHLPVADEGKAQAQSCGPVGHDILPAESVAGPLRKANAKFLAIDAEGSWIRSKIEFDSPGQSTDSSQKSGRTKA